MNFTVDRSRWQNGTTSKRYPEIADWRVKETALLNEAGNMCCLGFVCRQLKVPKKALLGTDQPGALELNLTTKARVDKQLSEDLVDDAIGINDSPNLQPRDREKQLRRLFAKHGHTLSFVGRTPAKMPLA